MKLMADISRIVDLYDLYKGNSYGDLMLPDGISIDDIDLKIGQPPDRSRIESIDWSPLGNIFTGQDKSVTYHLFKDDRLGKYVITQPRYVSSKFA